MPATMNTMAPMVQALTVGISPRRSKPIAATVAMAT